MEPKSAISPSEHRIAGEDVKYVKICKDFKG